MLTVWEIEQLGRSVARFDDLVDFVDGLRRRGVRLCSLRDRVDTTSFDGRLAFRGMAAVRFRA